MAVSTSTVADFENRMQSLRSSYSATLNEKLERLQRVAGRNLLNGDEKFVRSSMEEARALSHKLAGSAPVFGFNQLGQLSRLLEESLERLIDARALPDNDAVREIDGLLREIAQEARKSDVPVSAQAPIAAPKTVEAEPARTPRASEKAHSVLFAQRGNAFAQEFLFAFEQHGFSAKFADDFDVVVDVAGDYRPDVMIIAQQAEDIAGFKLAEALWKRPMHSEMEIFFLVQSQEFARRIRLNGISDEWLVYPPIDSIGLASRVLRRTFDIKMGRDAGNRRYMMPYLASFAKLAVSENEAALSNVERPSGVAIARKSVLVVDDDQHLVEALAELLMSRGFDVRKAYSGFQGLKEATENPPDIILTDFEMPNGSGEYFLTNLKKSEANAHTKVILVTGKSVLNKFGLDEKMASRLNVSASLLKPMDLEAVCQEVERQLASI